ncbi:hypothetical protein INS49_002739 [Diaporthe citri]|uniref:uncharacterized protein n=1 Tax=Diaporthe citri TaxID=83186 RepID=UPI001C825EE5|nr:uncharacterized protein INS49_002739 [Diaporthe citri]KAG6368529.1 hypothetical protein INS49_002739 [Diaporthe citri]
MTERTTVLENANTNWLPVEPRSFSDDYRSKMLEGCRQLPVYNQRAAFSEAAEKDRYLSKYSCVIVDEVHERGINTDLLMGILKMTLKSRKDFKVIIKPATLTVAKFAAHFQGAGVLSLAGRVFPVSLSYIKEATPDFLSSCLMVAINIHQNEDKDTAQKGGILIFLPGEEDIRTVCSVLAQDCPYMDVFPLYSGLSAAQQRRTLEPSTSRKSRLAGMASDIAWSHLAHPLSDRITQLNALHAFMRTKAEEAIDLERWCFDHFISEPAMDEVCQLRDQIKNVWTRELKQSYLSLSLAKRMSRALLHSHRGPTHLQTHPQKTDKMAFDDDIDDYEDNVPMPQGLPVESLASNSAPRHALQLVEACFEDGQCKTGRYHSLPSPKDLDAGVDNVCAVTGTLGNDMGAVSRERAA